MQIRNIFIRGYIKKSRIVLKCVIFLCFFCRQRDQKLDIVGLDARLVCRTVAADLPAFLASVYDDISFLGIDFHLYRPHDSSAGIGPVSGVDIHVQRA